MYEINEKDIIMHQHQRPNQTYSKFEKKIDFKRIY